MPNAGTLLFTLGSIVAVSAVSLIGVVILSLSEKMMSRILPLLVSFATGALLGNVFLHLLPEIIGGSPDIELSLALIFFGIILSFLIEKFIHWRHCHTLSCDHPIHPFGTMMLIGDGAHNLLDGILIATAYLVSTELGIATTIAVLLHEIPQEIGDFSVLLQSGYTRTRALLLNFLSALTACVGAMTVLLLSGNITNVGLALLPLTAGNFLYIAGSDLIPELHRETRIPHILLQLLMLLAGAAVLYALSLIGDAP